MGDFKGEIRVKFSMHDKAYRWSSGWVNMTPYHGPDDAYQDSTWQRFKEFIDVTWAKIMDAYEERSAEYERQERERQEREELARLKAKYEK